MTRQFIVTMPDGRMIGVVMDQRPMRADEASRHIASFGVRRLRDIRAMCAAVGATCAVELVHRPRYRRHARRYAELTYTRRIDLEVP